MEGLPISLLEALSYGTMSITSDIAPHLEIVGSLGCPTFPVGDIQAISDCLNLVETMAESRLNEFKNACIDLVLSRFNWKKATTDHDRLYRASL